MSSDLLKTNIRMAGASLGMGILMVFLCCLHGAQANPSKDFHSSENNFHVSKSLSFSLLQDIRRGRVTNEAGHPLPGVSILIKGTANGTVTDADGNYSISIPDPNAVLVFSFIGFYTQEVSVGQRNEIDVTLIEDTTVLKEVVVIGYGEQSRETLTTSVSKMDSKVLDNVPFANPASALQGTVSGVRVQTTTGHPAAEPRVIVRGGTSINNPDGAAPLYIIDGVIRSDMRNVNPKDIESMQVLKDAASTAIYGARGSNGVVLVTTKSGASNKTEISYSYSTTASQMGRQYDLITSRDYIKFFRLGVMATARKIPARASLLTQPNPGGTGNDLTKNTAYSTQYLSPENEHKLNEGWESMPDPLDPSRTIIFHNEDWQDILFRTGITHDHYLSARGGTDRATFSIGAGYLDSEGTSIGTDYRRLSLDLDGDLKVRDNLSLFGRLQYANGAQKGGSWLWDRSHAAPPTMKHRFEDGTLSPGDYFPSPEYRINSLLEKNSRDNLTMVVGGRWEILPGLSFNPQVSIYKIISDNRSFQKAYYTNVTQFNNTRNASASFSKYFQTQADAVFSYEKTLGLMHNVAATAGFAYFSGENSGFSAAGRGAATDIIPTLNAAAEPVAVSGSESSRKIFGYFARVNYDYDHKYLLSISGRYDGASVLGDENKWGFFPGVSVGWNLHKENFWSVFPEELLHLKLRASYGENGNISGLGDFQAQGQYAVGARYQGNAAIRNTVLANQNLQWEQSKTVDVGADIGLFGNRVSLVVDYYRRVTDQLLTTLQLPHATGFGSIFTNLGSLENRGIEIEVGAPILPSTSAFKWDIALNASKNRNKILKLPPNGSENNRIGGYNVWDSDRGEYVWRGGLQEGGTIGDMYAFKQVSVYSTDEEAANGPLDMLVVGNDKTKYGGDVNWLDNDMNDTIDIRDRVYLGNPYPAWTGGITNTFAYKNFSLVVRMDYMTGHTIYNWSRALMLAQYGAYGGVVTDVLNSWQEQGDVTNIPRYYWADQQTQRNIARLGNTNPDGGNSQFFESGNYLALREVSLSYTIPGSVLRRAKLSNMRVYVSGHNLHYFTKYKGLSPEEGGADFGGYPIPRNIIIGVNVSL